MEDKLHCVLSNQWDKVGRNELSATSIAVELSQSKTRISTNEPINIITNFANGLTLSGEPGKTLLPTMCIMHSSLSSATTSYTNRYAKEAP